MSLILETPKEIAQRLAHRVREDRLARGWTQEELAARAGIELPTYRKFEREGQISLERLISLSSTLGRLSEWETLLRPRPATSLEEVVGKPTRHRARRSRAV